MYVKSVCYNSADWPNEKKAEIDKAIKKCLEVMFVLFLCLEIGFLKKKNHFPKQKIATNNKELKEVLNEKYKKVKKLGSGALREPSMKLKTCRKTAKSKCLALSLV